MMVFICDESVPPPTTIYPFFLCFLCFDINKCISNKSTTILTQVRVDVRLLYLARG